MNVLIVLPGSDHFGDWLGSPAGMPMRRPGWTTKTDAECALLVPAEGDFVASFNGRGVPTAIYVDATDRPRWDGDTVRAVDLELAPRAAAGLGRAGLSPAAGGRQAYPGVCR